MSIDLAEAVKQDVVQLNGLFRLLADPTRLTILLILMDQREHNVTTLCERIGLPQPTVSHHLSLMRSRNLVKRRRQGKKCFYKLLHFDHNEDGRAELSILLKHSALRLAFLDAADASLDNPGRCAT